jgi:hypothetical protein
MILKHLQAIPDHRLAQGQRYDLAHVLLFTILAIASGANSYRQVHTFMKVHFERLHEYFEIKWKKAPAYTSIRDIIQRTNKKELEVAFRAYSQELKKELGTGKHACVGLDGKVLRGSFDHFQDQKAIQVLSAFLGEEQLILAHETIEEKTNEIPVAQDLFKHLGLEDAIFTLDALHGQKKQ